MYSWSDRWCCDQVTCFPGKNRWTWWRRYGQRGHPPIRDRLNHTISGEVRAWTWEQEDRQVCHQHWLLSGISSSESSLWVSSQWDDSHHRGSSSGIASESRQSNRQSGGGEFLAHRYLLHVVRMRYITIYINMLQVISGENTMQRSLFVSLRICSRMIASAWVIFIVVLISSCMIVNEALHCEDSCFFDKYPFCQ